MGGVNWTKTAKWTTSGWAGSQGRKGGGRETNETAEIVGMMTTYLAERLYRLSDRVTRDGTTTETPTEKSTRSPEFDDAADGDGSAEPQMFIPKV